MRTVASGRCNLCEHLTVVGCQTAGALAEAFVASAEWEVVERLVPVGRWGTADLPCAQAAEAFRTAGAPGAAPVKVHPHPQR